jgi:hypothetical protein
MYETLRHIDTLPEGSGAASPKYADEIPRHRFPLSIPHLFISLHTTLVAQYLRHKLPSPASSHDIYGPNLVQIGEI